MAHAVEISQAEMEAFLLPLGFQTIKLPNTQELVYAKIVRRGQNAYSLRIYSSITWGVSRGVGQDAIRVSCWVKVPREGGAIDIVMVGGSKRVHRVEGWKKNLQDRLDRWEECLGPDCPKCGSPTALRKPGRGKNFKPFYGCVCYPNCKGSVSIAQSPEREKGQKIDLAAEGEVLYLESLQE